MYTRIPKHEISFKTDKTLHEEAYSTIKKSKSTNTQKSTSAIGVQTNSQPATPCSEIIPFYDNSFLSTKYNYSQGFSPPDDYSLDFETLQQKQSQLLRTVYSYRNDKPEFLTPLITGTPSLHANYKIFTTFHRRLHKPYQPIHNE